MTSLILASASPRRLDLLRSIGIDPRVVPSHIEERLGSAETPEDYATRLSAEKARSVGSRFPDEWILAADTIVVLDGKILEKPADAAEAKAMLRRLSGAEHVVLTGVTLYHQSRAHNDTTLTRTAVRILPMEPEEIQWYVGAGESMDKAGAYAAQGTGALFIESISGSYSNVVGLPLATVYRMMKKVGLGPAQGNQ